MYKRAVIQTDTHNLLVRLQKYFDATKSSLLHIMFSYVKPLQQTMLNCDKQEVKSETGGLNISFFERVSLKYISGEKLGHLLGEECIAKLATGFSKLAFF